MVTLNTLKAGDRFSCPVCHRSVGLYTEGAARGQIRSHNEHTLGTPCDGQGYNPFRPDYPQRVRLFGKQAAIKYVRHMHGPPDWVPEEDLPGYVRPVANLDLTTPGSGILLVTGSKWETSPQALLGRHNKRNWYVEDYYGDDGRKDYYGVGLTKKFVVSRYMEFLGYAEDTWTLKIEKEY